jgi:RNA polymerase sigma-70 factor (ECF subfamily)
MRRLVMLLTQDRHGDRRALIQATAVGRGMGGAMSQLEMTTSGLLLERVREGDPTARGELIARFERRLRSLTRRMIREFPLVHRYEQMEDVFQAAIIRLCRALESVPLQSSRDLIRLSARQVRLELLKLAGRYRGRPGLLCLDEVSADSAMEMAGIQGGNPNCVHQRVGARDESRLLDRWADFHEAAEVLPEEEREVFDLIWYQEMSQQEAAELLGVCVRTVGYRWRKARLALVAALDGQLPGL